MTSNSKIVLIIVALIIAAGLAFYLFPQPAQAPDTQSITVPMQTYSDSSQEGTATLIEQDGQVIVTIDLMNYTTDTPQPAHIHSGLCPRIGPIIYSLNDIVNNHSTTTLDTTLADLLAENPDLNINVHESYDAFEVYTSCGDVPR